MALPALIQGLLDPAAYPHPVAEVRLIETHISWVLIAGDFAYKLKKPVDLGFLDFSSLAKRRHFCAEEVRLNRRLAPDIYLGSVPVTGTPVLPRMDGSGEALEWAVKMRAFPADATLDREERITPEQIDAIADRVARFHGEAASVAADSAFGDPASVMHPVQENFRQIRGLKLAHAPLDQLSRLEAWSEDEGARLQEHFRQRKAAGFVRDCHGDLHLRNIAWVDEAPLIFDCIEFNPALRCIDIISEVAFMAMDLIHRDQAPLAWRFLNRWLEHTGDYDGIKALRFYLVYRAMVRAKVACIRAAQSDPDAQREAEGYLRLAEHLGHADRPALLLMHGFSGCGKTWLSQRLLEALGCLRLRSDVERKRLAGLGADERSASQLAGGIYTPEATRRTFAHLHDLASGLLDAGYSVILDATFLKHETRRPFLDLARTTGRPLRILSLQAAPELLRARILHRSAQGRDVSEADLAVLEHQLQHHTPLDAEEQGLAVLLDADDSAAWPDSRQAWLALLRLAEFGAAK